MMKMFNARIAWIVAASLAVAPCLPGLARAENQMGYRLLSAEEAAGLPRNRGSLGMDIERAQQITDGGMTFDIIRVKQVRRGSPGAQAGFNSGDQIIAVDGRVFPSLMAFAAYIGSMPAGTPVSVDYIPANGGPAQAQRASVTVGNPTQPTPRPAEATGLSTGTKVAIGVGAVALLGCYEMGCFSRKRDAAPVHVTPRPQPQQYQPQGVQRQ